MDDGGSVTQLSRDLSRLQAQVQSLRLALLRSAVAVCLALLLAGAGDVGPGTTTSTATRRLLECSPPGSRLSRTRTVAERSSPSASAFSGFSSWCWCSRACCCKQCWYDDWHPNRGRVFRRRGRHTGGRRYRGGRAHLRDRCQLGLVERLRRLGTGGVDGRCGAEHCCTGQPVRFAKGSSVAHLPSAVDALQAACRRSSVPQGAGQSLISIRMRRRTSGPSSICGARSKRTEWIVPV